MVHQSQLIHTCFYYVDSSMLWWPLQANACNTSWLYMAHRFPRLRNGYGHYIFVNIDVLETGTFLASLEMCFWLAVLSPGSGNAPVVLVFFLVVLTALLAAIGFVVYKKSRARFNSTVRYRRTIDDADSTSIIDAEWDFTWLHLCSLKKQLCAYSIQYGNIIMPANWNLASISFNLFV